MKKCVFVILLLSLFNGVASAQTKPVTLSGMIIVNGRDTVPYKVVVIEVNGEVNGYSLTYNQPYDTKAKISGSLDRQHHTLDFKETEIVYIKGYHSGPSLCLVNAALNEMQGSNGENLLTGPITSKESDHTSCAGGEVIFSNKEEIQDLFSYHEKYDTVISMKSRRRDITDSKNVVPSVAPLPLTTDNITTGEEKTYDWYTDSAIIDIWDGGNVDGDRVTIQLNGQTYLSAYSLVKEKKQLRIPLSKNMNTITIHADNEGSDPPNTASLLLTDGNKQYSVLAYNKKGQEAVIKLKRVSHSGH